MKIYIIFCWRLTILGHFVVVEKIVKWHHCIYVCLQTNACIFVVVVRPLAVYFDQHYEIKAPYCERCTSSETAGK